MKKANTKSKSKHEERATGITKLSVPRIYFELSL